MDTITLERNIWINAPRERVWQAITDPDQIIKWLVPNMSFATMQRDESGKISVHMGEMGIDFVTMEVQEPLRRATSRSLPEQMLTISYTLDDENNGTRFSVRMSGFESLAEDARQDRLRMSGEGWEQTLQNLKAFIDGKDLPFPQAYVGPLFGFWREPKQKIAIERSIWIKASRERVWQAITDPEQIRAWFSPSSVFKATGSEVGARLYVEEPETGNELYVQILELVDPPYQLATRSVEESHVTLWTLNEENGGTRLSITYSGYELEPADKRHPMMEENAFGFGMMLGNIKAVTEGQPVPFPMGF